MALIEPARHPATRCPPLPEFSARTRLMVVAPHPDDETIAAGVLIQRVLGAGGSVSVLLLTRGDNNPWPQRFLERRLVIGADDRLRWGQRRQQEMLAAMEQLGLPPTALECLGWPDLGVTDLLLDHPDRSCAMLGDAIARFDPDLLVFPALADRHPDHSAAHVLARLALSRLEVRPACFVYPVHGRSDSAVCTGVGGTVEQVAGKLAALDEHRSQMALSRKRMRRLALRPESLLPLDGVALDCLPWIPPLALRPWLRLNLASVAGGFSWRWNEAPLAHDDRGFRLCLTGPDRRHPRFVKLTCSLPSPWIFDRWGWCQLAPADGGLA